LGHGEARKGATDQRRNGSRIGSRSGGTVKIAVGKNLECEVGIRRIDVDSVGSGQDGGRYFGRAGKEDGNRAAAAEVLNAVAHSVRTVYGSDTDHACRERLWGDEASGCRDGKRGQTVAADPELQEFAGCRGVRGGYVELVGSGIESDPLRDDRVGRGGCRHTLCCCGIRVGPVDVEFAAVLPWRIRPRERQWNGDRARRSDSQSLVGSGGELVDVVVYLAATGARDGGQMQRADGDRCVGAFPVAAVVVPTRSEQRHFRVLCEELCNSRCVCSTR